MHCNSFNEATAAETHCNCCIAFAECTAIVSCSCKDALLWLHCICSNELPATVAMKLLLQERIATVVGYDATAAMHCSSFNEASAVEMHCNCCVAPAAMHLMNSCNEATAARTHYSRCIATAAIHCSMHFH